MSQAGQSQTGMVAVNMVTSYAVRRSHEAVLRMLDGLSDEQLRAGSRSSPPIAFHVWHLARWADLLQSRMPGMTPALGERLGEGVQIWDSEKLADAWGFSGMDLGGDATGYEDG